MLTRSRRGAGVSVGAQCALLVWKVRRGKVPVVVTEGSCVSSQGVGRSGGFWGCSEHPCCVGTAQSITQYGAASARLCPRNRESRLLADLAKKPSLWASTERQRKFFQPVCELGSLRGTTLSAWITVCGWQWLGTGEVEASTDCFSKHTLNGRINLETPCLLGFFFQAIKGSPFAGTKRDLLSLAHFLQPVVLFWQFSHLLGGSAEPNHSSG